MTAVFRFRIADLYDDLPEPGYYPGTIVSARFRRSSRGNPMLQVVHRLEGVPEGYAKVADYFVLEGVSSRGAATARRRLAQLCRASGLDDRQDEVTAAELVDIQLAVKVGHDKFGDEPRLKVVGYRRLGQGELDIPF
jgi:hypothetical protein